MKFDKTQKRALVFVAGLLGLSWYMGGQFEKADMMRSEGKRPCCSKPSMFFTMRGLSCYNCSKEDRIYRPAKEDSFNQMRSEADAYAYAYNEGHSDNRKDEDYQPVLSSGREEGRFRKILKQRAETFNAELEEEEFGEYFLDMDVYDDILSYTPVGDEIGFFGNDGFVEIHVRDEFVGDAYVWRDSLMEEEFGGEHPYIIINNEMFHLNDLKEIDLGAETFNAQTTKKPKLTKTQLAALNMMKASTFYGSGGYAYVEVDNRGWKSYTTRPVQGLLDKGIITIPKDENRRFYGRVKSMEAYIVYLNPVAWEYPFRYDYDKSLSQVGNKIVQNKKIQQQEHSRILKQKQDEENMTLEEVLDELFGAETMTPSEVKVKVIEDVTPKGSKLIVEECVDIQAKKADTTSNYYRVRFRDPAEMSNFRVPAWAARAANTMGSKYYDVAGSKVTMGQDKSGNWKIQSVMVPKRANVDVDLALKIANHIQDRLEKEGKWAPKKCQDNERVLVIR